MAPHIVRSGVIGNVNVTIVKSEADMGELVGDILASAIRDDPQIILGLCTGGTPVPVYHRLISLYAERRLSLASVTTFNLDEYYPIHPADPASYQQFMRRQLFDHTDIDIHRTHFPNCLTTDPEESAQRYEALLKDAGGIDLLLTGIGHNTHIGFNEPPTSATSRTRLVILSDETREANARFFSSPSQVPSQSITMGLGTILSARAIVLCAYGKDKADAVRLALTAEPDDRWPGTFIQQHTNCAAVIEENAAEGLTL